MMPGVVLMGDVTPYLWGMFAAGCGLVGGFLVYAALAYRRGRKQEQDGHHEGIHRE